MERLKFTVKRSEWLNGDVLPTCEAGCLFDPSTKRRCCLGFYCQQLAGSSDDEMKTVAMPIDLGLIPNDFEEAERELDEKQLEALRRVVDCDYVEKIAHINDQRGITQHDREQRLIEAFNVLGVDVEFVD